LAAAQGRGRTGACPAPEDFSAWARDQNARFTWPYAFRSSPSHLRANGVFSEQAGLFVAP
jgi:hypothetical protein